MNLIKNETELFTCVQAAKVVGLPVSTYWHYVRTYKLVQPPQVKRGKRKFYTQEQLNEVVETVTQLRARGVINGR